MTRLTLTSRGSLLVAALAIAGCGAAGEDELPAPAAEARQDTAPAAARTQGPGLTVPAGFVATEFAKGLNTPRHLAVADNGDVYVVLRAGAAKFNPVDQPGGLIALRDDDGDGVADQEQWFGPPDTDTGLAIRDGVLYFSSMTRVYAMQLGEQLVPTSALEVVVDELPESGSGHRTKALTFDVAGNLYVQVGSPSNSCQQDPGVGRSPGLMPCMLLDAHGGVFQYPAASRGAMHAEAGQRYSTGHRNLVALEWNPGANALYALMHGRDGLSQLWPEYFSEAMDIEIPAEEFHRIEAGDDLGWPYTYWDPLRGERMVMPEYGGDGQTPTDARGYNTPLVAFPGHWAPNDLVFYTGEQFPAQYRNGAFIAFHGAVVPRRPERGGYAVAFVPMNAAGEVTGNWELFADDFEVPAPGSALIGRPAGLAIGPDGSLYISDDAGGRIFKVSYVGE